MNNTNLKILQKENILALFMILLTMTSCKITTHSLRTMRIEIMKPISFALPVNVKTVAIFNRDISKNKTPTLSNFGEGNSLGDTTLNNFELSDYCVDGLTSFFEQEGNFRKVIHYHHNDSISHITEGPNMMYKSSDLLDVTKADALIFLDFFQLENKVSSFYDGTFRSRAALSWSLIYKDDTPSDIYNQIDTIFFDKSQYTDIQHNNSHKKQIYQDAANYLGKCFGTKIIPSWILSERSYYKSYHPEMLKAEIYIKNQDWLKAAEIWNKQTKNKNHKIAAKACFNMALACELEGKYDLAMEWLIDSNNILTKNNYQHRAICQQYLRVLTLRKYEIEKLEKQIRK